MVFMTGGLMGRAASPEQRVGFTYSDQTCSRTVGANLHFSENISPKRLNRTLLAESILISSSILDLFIDTGHDQTKVVIVICHSERLSIQGPDIDILVIFHVLL